jgi:hypothetical protein
MKNSNNTREVIGAKDLTNNAFSHARLRLDESFLRIKIIIPTLLMIIILAITVELFGSCFGVLRIHDSGRGGGGGHGNSEGHDNGGDHHDNGGGHHDFNNIKPLNK